jgi:hypothetical protein
VVVITVEWVIEKLVTRLYHLNEMIGFLSRISFTGNSGEMTIKVKGVRFAFIEVEVVPGLFSVCKQPASKFVQKSA